MQDAEIVHPDADMPSLVRLVSVEPPYILQRAVRIYRHLIHRPQSDALASVPHGLSGFIAAGSGKTVFAQLPRNLCRQFVRMFELYHDSASGQRLPSVARASQGSVKKWRQTSVVFLSQLIVRSLSCWSKSSPRMSPFP